MKRGSEKKILRLVPALLAFDLDELRELEEWIWNRASELMRREDDDEDLPIGKGREVFKQVRGGAVTYRLEGVRCGKDPCKCTRGKLHGPYWYSYYRDGGRLVSKYVGKKLPKGVDA